MAEWRWDVAESGLMVVVAVDGGDDGSDRQWRGAEFGARQTRKLILPAVVDNGDQCHELSIH